MLDITKWKHAVIQLECVKDSITDDERINNIREQQIQLSKGEIKLDEFSKKISEDMHDIRELGTAILIKEKEDIFLVSAWHVVSDENSSNGKSNLRKLILRVPSYDEVGEAHDISPLPFLMNLQAGSTFSTPFVFSEEFDLVVISLNRDRMLKKFIEDILSKGYSPIDIKSVSDEPTCELADVETVGFPRAVSMIKVEGIPKAVLNWRSGFCSLPVFCSGKVAMIHKDILHFWIDITSLPGNSGGPIIENDRLVGIITEQAFIPTDIDKPGKSELEEAKYTRVRVPITKAIKSRFVKDLIKELRSQEAEFDKILHRK